MNEVLVRPNKATVIHAGKSEEPQGTGNTIFFQFLLEMVYLSPLRLF